MFQLPRHQAILRFHGMVLACGPVTFIARSFQSLLPMLMETVPLLLALLGRAETQLQRRRFQDTQQLMRDQLVESLPGQALAERFAIVDLKTIAGVTEPWRRAGVLNCHPMVAATTDQQAGEQRRPFPRGTAGFRSCAVLGQPLLIGQELLPGDVGRIMVANQDLALLPRDNASSRSWATWNLAPRIDRTPTVAVCTCITGMVQDVQQRLAARTPPLYVPAIRAAVRTNPQTNSVSYQVLQQPVDCAQFCELLEEKPHHRLHLLIRIEG